MKNNRGEALRYGPEPAAGNSALSRLSQARREVLDVLVNQPEPVTAHHIARSLHQHHNTIREHLDGLRRVGLVVRIKGPVSGRGRPPWFYAATEKARDDSAANDYAGLAAALAAQIARNAENPVAEAIDAGKHWGASLTSGATQAQEPAIDRILVLLDDLGYSPEVCSRDNDTDEAEFKLRRCPLLAAANEHPEIVCGVHQGLVQGALDTQGADGLEIELFPFAEPGACTMHMRRTEGTQP